ncbi:MAG: HAD family hydrolase [Eubacterium sp.]|nr:HAD family hydrolase [Eubacterium sp.]
MKYRLAIFDMDGTILNTLDDLADSTNYALREHGLPERTLDEVRQFVGNGIRKLIERAVPEGSGEETIVAVHDTFTAYYKEHCAVKTKPYDGIPELIQTLRDQGVLTAVVSNKADYGVQALCEDYFKGLFDCAVGEREGVQRKPSPDSVNMVLKELGVAKEDAVYIGDSEVDYKTSVNAGLDVIMVGWGFRREEYLKKCGAEFVVHKPEEVLERMK